jgi:hypothetical protein
MEEFLDIPECDNFSSPETLAWKLLTDENCKDHSNILLPVVENNDDIQTNPETLTDASYDNNATQFELLISIYMEMIFGLLKINHINSLLNDDGELDSDIDYDMTFDPDLSKFSKDDMLLLFREKMKKIRIFLSIHEIYDADIDNYNDFGSSSEYYCKIILKDTDHGRKHFLKYANSLDPKKRYTFLIRQDKEKKQRKLDDFYGVCSLPNMKLRISFSPINILLNN